jgi:hypothetical protein
MSVDARPVRGGLTYREAARIASVTLLVTHQLDLEENAGGNRTERPARAGGGSTPIWCVVPPVAAVMTGQMTVWPTRGVRTPGDS